MSEPAKTITEHAPFGRSREYPLLWRVFDLVNRAAERLSPATPAAAPVLLLLPAILLVSLLVFGLAIIVDQSFHKLDTGTFTLGRAFTLANYVSVFGRSHYRELFARTTAAALVVALFSLVLGFPFAYVMVRAQSAVVKKLMLCCVFLPFLLGGVVRGYAWLVVLGRAGLVNELLKQFGIAPVPLIYNMTGVLIGQVQLFLPIAILMIAPAITAIGEEVGEAAQSLGARWPRIFWTVILPMARPGLMSAFVIVFTLVFSDMVVPMILGGGRTDYISNEIYKSYLETGDRGIGAALCVSTTAVVTGAMALIFLLRWLVTRRRARLA